MAFGVSCSDYSVMGVVGFAAVGGFGLFLEVCAGNVAVEVVESAVFSEAVGVAGDDAVGVGIIGGSGEVAAGIGGEEGAACAVGVAGGGMA